MKTKIFILILWAITLSTYSQAESSSRNSQWKYYFQQETAKSYFYFYTEGDTIIDNISRAKLYVASDNSSKGSYLAGFLHTAEKKGYFRYQEEENYSLIDGFYGLNLEYETDYLIYDFSLEKGDEFKLHLPEQEIKFYISDVDSIETNSIKRKRYTIRNSPESEQILTYWIEGVGSTDGLFYQELEHWITCECFKLFVCCSEDGETLYLNPEFNECPHFPSPPFEVNIGNDTTFCADCIGEDMKIAPNLLIKGGVAPYTYTWNGQIRRQLGDGNYYSANCFLNDTTLANPYLTDIWYNIWNKFTLTVEDSKGNIAKDSIMVRFSAYYESPLGYAPITIIKGDSILLEVSDRGGILPYSHIVWSPGEWLSDPNSSSTWCKAEREVTYSYQFVDSVGCPGSSANPIWIIVNPASILSLDDSSDFYQHGEYVFFTNDKGELIQLSFYDLSGRLLEGTVTKKDRYKPNLKNQTGTFLCRITKGKNTQVIKYLIEN